MDAPKVKYDSSDSESVIITWTTPYNNLDPITGYSIVFLSSEYVYTDGFSRQTLYYPSDECIAESLDTLSCYVSINALANHPFNLSEGVRIRAKVQAENSFGYGPLSDENNSGAFMPVTKVEEEETVEETVEETEEVVTVTELELFNERWAPYDYAISTCDEEEYESTGFCIVVPMPKPDYF